MVNYDRLLIAAELWEVSWSLGADVTVPPIHNGPPGHTAPLPPKKKGKLWDFGDIPPQQPTVRRPALLRPILADELVVMLPAKI